MRLHQFAVLVFGKAAAGVTRYRRLTGCAANADGENLHAVLRGSLRSADRFPIKIFAISDQDENPPRRCVSRKPLTSWTLHIRHHASRYIHRAIPERT
jgi:hypothetical protein